MDLVLDITVDLPGKRPRVADQNTSFNYLKILIDSWHRVYWLIL
jgi:hypothetical protein